MTAYEERIVDACVDADITATLLVSEDGSDAAIWPMRPVDEHWMSPEELSRRKLRSIGVVGLHGDVPRFAFRDPLPLDVVNRVAWAFAEFVRERRAMNAELSELAELEALYRLPDNRMN